MKTSDPKKIFVALSGGVDSSVSAALLKQQGYDVTGVFMKNWSGDNFGLQSECPWEQDQKDAEAVCSLLGIPFRSFNFEKEYRAKVVDYFFKEYRAGRTPNPDVLCNREIKFGIFLERSLKEGADLIATGHYARVRYNKDIEEYELLKGLDPNKDQSYFLCELDQSQLSRTLFPVGALTKPEVRVLAEQLGLPVAKKPDSQGICFIGEINVGHFLRENIKQHPGDIIDADTGKKVGEHDGIEFYTIGQREGLKIGGSARPYFVVGKDKGHNIINVAMGQDNPRIFKTVVAYEDLKEINSQKYWEPKELTAMLRYRQRPAAGEIDLANCKFTFNDPQRAVAEGQKIAFYYNEVLCGSATLI